MEFSTEVIKKMAEILVKEMGKASGEFRDIQEVETCMRGLLQKVGAEGMKMYLEQTDEMEVKEEEIECECQGKQEYLFRREAKILSVFGRVSYKRKYYVCKTCGKGHCPLDKRLHIAAGEVTAGLAELLALGGIETAFAESSRFIERFLLFRVSDNTIRKETQRFGELQKAREEEWKKQSQDESWLQERIRRYGKQAGRLYGSIDGVMTPCKGEWREMKNLTWYRVEPVRSYQKHRHHASRVGEQNDLQAQEITYHCDIQPPDQFGELLWATACQRKADLYEEVVFVCDGAIWIWKLIERHFPHAVQIVDWYHASQYLPPIAEAAFGYDTPEYHAWLEQTRSLLWEGQIDNLIHNCRILGSIQAARKAVDSAVTYFTNNRKRMDYAHFRQQGYFIGSGTVESAGKQIGGMRLKRAGARWLEPGAIATAKARAAWLSNQWDELTALRSHLPLVI
ncbi:MAG: ISKra4 family transposase [Candidatus Bathyarchaeota archaeon]|nr:ISKra4 family transposase [Candidatus Bathyarchaeota archaeon]